VHPEFIKKNNRSDHTDKVEDEVSILMLQRPSGAFGGLVGMGREIPVKIIAAQGGKKNKPVIIAGNIKMKKVTALPGHKNRAERDVNAAKNKKIKDFPETGQFF